jgi:hypothetical protein
MVPENKQNKRYKRINFIGLQKNRHPPQHTVRNVHKAFGNSAKASLGIDRRTTRKQKEVRQAPDQGSMVDD